MKFRKGFLAFVITLVMVLHSITIVTIPAFAHDSILDVDYDNCLGVLDSDGVNETWYVLEQSAQTSHISHEVHTISYYFEEKYPGTNITWVPEGQSSTVGDEIKTAYANSMKKWNNVYFYSYNQDGTITKNKLINVVEGSANNHNLTIYPVTGVNGMIAGTGVAATSDELIIETGTTTHAHYSDWVMLVNIDYFYPHAQLTNDIVNFIKDRNGAHELGHVLGLLDVDNEHLCGSTLEDQHHYELLMGYGEEMLDRSSNITYKDIAGVAITRGFHTDSDHKWLNCGLQSDGKYKLVCSICNGVKNVASLNGYIYQTYGACGGNHNLSSGNMLAVASYGNKDYYKCEYCRYVAPFSSIVTQNYSRTYYGNNLDKYTNTVSGLEYSFYKEHSHSYSYRWVSDTRHERTCRDCGEVSTAAHVVAHGAFPTPEGYAICLQCHGNVFMGVLQSIPAGLAHTDNGSYILTNGTIVLVEEDVEAYMAGTLEFYYGEKE